MSTDSKDYLVILEARLTQNHLKIGGIDLVGYGRDKEEARSHAGFDDPPNKSEQFTEVIVKNGDCNYSHDIADRICKFHIDEDEDIPENIKKNLQVFLSSKQYASAVNYCFNMIWDRGFEEN